MSTSTGDPTNPGTAAPQARLVRRPVSDPRCFDCAKSGIAVRYTICEMSYRDFLQEYKVMKIERKKKKLTIISNPAPWLKD
jgi:hypothetical protein